MAQGLVVREPDPEDRRQVFVLLTDHGRAVLEKLASAHRAELRRLGPQLHQMLDYLAPESEEN